MHHARFLKEKMPPFLNFLFDVVHKRVLPRGECRYEANF